MFSIFSIIKQFIFFIIIFVSFHFTYNYFRNLFLNKRCIFTPNEKFEEIHQLLRPTCPLTPPTNEPSSLTPIEIQTLEKESKDVSPTTPNTNENENIEKSSETIDNPLISSIDY